MPRAPARIRKRYIEGQTEVLDWEIEECLVYGYPLVFDVHATMRTVDQWQVAWSRWRDVVLPKCIEHRPGLRPVAMYVLGEIPRRELRMPPPADAWWSRIAVRDRRGRIVEHWLNVPQPFMEPEATYLHRLGIVSDDELRRHRAWMRQRNPGRSVGLVDTYPLEMSLHE